MMAPPGRKMLISLRLMILTGICCMVFFTFNLLKADLRGYIPLYTLLIITFVFILARTLYEWYHYWSISINKSPPAKEIFTVDIFTTFCTGEPYEMIVETLEAIQKITYPHQTYLCDEQDDPYLKDVCRRLGVHHITRTNKADAKAGNINNALKQSAGELCVVLDPDHVPFPDFLDVVVNYFNDPGIGYVQVVQAYSNQDQGWIAKGAAQQTYQYYGPMMMTMNTYGTAQAIGANCTFRRTALESIGGHAAGLAEDMHTSMQLHAHGWKSVYLPLILSRGLVPATLSAYYKQQLKWSRGVFELFVTSYIRLFSRFTWRQKLHYGLVPMFYLSGFIYLLNFIIPVVSLFFGVYPLKMDFSEFAVISLPFITSILIIRQYVQRWVTEDQERGFHVVGGLLLIGTWWIFILGFIYTVIRKKIPYIPTPKDISEERNLGINIPNIVVLTVSLSAIAYGLYNDWNPFTLIMAGICSVNCCTMVFMLIASQQHRIRSFQKRHQVLRVIADNVDAAKRRLWLLRRKMYSGIRSISLLLIVLSVCAAIYYSNRPYKTEPVLLAPHYKDILLTGISDPESKGGSVVAPGARYAKDDPQYHVDIVSLYVPWGEQPGCNISSAVVDSIYNKGSTPMITWEPVQNLFRNFRGKDELVFQHIAQGRYDHYIIHTARQLRALNRPVFLRFAHEADNLAHPWSARGGNTPGEFKTAWHHVHDLFISQAAWNVIWVWNPWKAGITSDYFPGREYADWIGISNFNEGDNGADTSYQSFRQLYMPFHRLSVSKPGLPVMIAETAAAADGGGHTQWLQAGIKDIRREFQEVKAIVVRSEHDRKVLSQFSKTISSQDNSRLSPSVHAGNRNNNPPAATLKKSARPKVIKRFAGNIRGVLYTKGQNWHGTEYAVNKQTIINDFRAMRAAGFNTVKIYGPNIYDRITFQAASRTGMKVIYCFWVPDPSLYLSDKSLLPKLSEQIAATVENLKKNESIRYWHIGNNTLQQLGDHFLQPELFYRRQLYMNWLRKLVRRIKAEDPSRMVSLDVKVTSDLSNITSQVQDQLPEVDALGLIMNEDLQDTAQIGKLTLPYYFSSVKPELYFKLQRPLVSAFMENWQDQQTASGISFFGLKDTKGRNKAAFYEVTRHWTGKKDRYQLPDIKILRPAQTTVPGEVLPYHSLVNKHGKWNLAQNQSAGMQFEWYQVHTDRWGVPLSMNFLSKGPYLLYRIPPDPKRYQLYLVGVSGNNITEAHSVLNIPLKR